MPIAFTSPVRWFSLIPVAFLVACDSGSAPLRQADPGRPLLTVSPQRLDFPELDLNDGRTDEVVVFNGDSATLTIDVVTIEGTGRASFSARPDETIKIGGGRSTKLTVTFTPQVAGSIEAEMVLFHDARGGAPIRVPLTGRGRECIDMDGDGFGDGCVPGPDCRDDVAEINPGAAEVCDGDDNNCDGNPDEGFDVEIYYRDADMDGFGTDDVPPLMGCAQPTGFVPQAGDCRDDLPAVNPNGTEVCTGGIDEDCDGFTDGEDSECGGPPPPDAGFEPDAAPPPDSGQPVPDAGMAIPFCTTQDDCGLTSNRMTCPLIGAGQERCAPVCRSGGECATGSACRPLPGSASLGFCQATSGTLAEGAACNLASECADGVCIQNACRRICQRQADCGTTDVCGVALYNTNELGGRDARRLTTVCRPVLGRQPLGGSCNLDAVNVDTGLCATEHCDLPPWSAMVSPQALCAAVCTNAQDCGAGQVCGAVYNGLAENPQLFGTFEGPGRYFEMVLGCNTPYFFDGLSWQPQPPGRGALGATCDPTQPIGRLACRSHLCAQFPPIRGRCTDFCKTDSDCNSPSTPGWGCHFGELNHASVFLQDYGIGNPTIFSLVGVCAP